jgi:hypothetical protein
MKREDTEQRWVDTFHKDRSTIPINVIQYSSIFYLVQPETQYTHTVSLTYLEETSCSDEDRGRKEM